MNEFKIRYKELLEDLAQYSEERLLSNCVDDESINVVKVVLEYKKQNNLK